MKPSDSATRGLTQHSRHGIAKPRPNPGLIDVARVKEDARDLASQGEIGTRIQC